MTLRKIGRFGLAVACLGGLACSAAAEGRVALVIGNGGYKAVAALNNPPSDARDVGDALKALGFDVEVDVDADQARMRADIAAFAKKAEKADVSLFFYSGHGLQVSEHNYLVPVDAEFHVVDDIQTRTVAFDDVMAALARTSGLRLVFLDACRNNPVKNLALAQQGQGLAEAGESAGFFIAYATKPNFVAYDGAGRNSPFTQAFLAHVATPGEDISNLMIAVRNDVFAATGGEQVPWDSSSLTREFFFVGAGKGETTPEGLLWQAAAKDRDRNLLAIYLDRYPKGPHADDARSLFAQAGGERPPSASAENDLWRLTLSSRQRPLVELYLARYPQGAHHDDAARLLESVKGAEAASKDPGVVCEKLATVPADATASAAGVDFATLASHAAQAIDACRAAVQKRPDIAHYVALLARALYAGGQYEEAVADYRQAAQAGDARAMVSLALLMEAGDHVAKDIDGAYALYAKAAEKGNADGAINLGFALAQGKFVEKNVARAFELFKKASDWGSARATYDLAALTENGVGGRPEDALNLFKKAASLGEATAHRAAAVLLDEGRHTTRDPKAAAAEMLACVGADSGDCLGELIKASQSWSPDTIKAMQSMLKAENYYFGPINGRAGPELAPALKQWRLLGGTNPG